MFFAEDGTDVHHPHERTAREVSGYGEHCEGLQIGDGVKVITAMTWRSAVTPPISQQESCTRWAVFFVAESSGNVLRTPPPLPCWNPPKSGRRFAKVDDGDRNRPRSTS